MNNKHKHYDKIVAKAANVGLVQFIKMNENWEDAGLSDKFISFSEGYDYFLCLPQHKDACLHWLNGGNIQYRIALDAWTDAADNESDAAWTPDNLFIDDQVEFRIKPKKERRWIIWNENQDSYHFTFLVDPSDRYEANFKFSIHEIEVEV